MKHMFVGSVSGLHEMTDGLIVLQVVKIADTQGCSFFLSSCGYRREEQRAENLGTHPQTCIM